MYSANDLDDLMRIIIARGIEKNPEGIDHKHNEGVPGSPRSPIKLHLCTPNLRKEAKMTEDDMMKIIHMWWQYIERHRLMVPAIGCIPRVGEKYALMLQEYVLNETGRYIPVVLAQKTYFPDGTRQIAGVLPSKEYPSGDIWIFDDLINWGRSHLEALERYTEAGYRVTDCMVAADYGVNANLLLGNKGARLHSLVSLDSILMLGKGEKSMETSIIAQTKAYLAASRLANTWLPEHLVDKQA